MKTKVHITSVLAAGELSGNQNRRRGQRSGKRPRAWKYFEVKEKSTVSAAAE